MIIKFYVRLTMDTFDKLGKLSESKHFKSTI